MAGEIAHLDASLDSLETEEIELLWKLEPLDDTVQRIKREAASAAQRRESLVEAISIAQARLATEIASLQAHRSELLPEIPSAVLALYEKILIKVRDVAAVELVDGICGGCKIAGVAMDIGRWRTSTVDSLVTCPACTRLWIPAS
jgi:predicted  nucleic acid-binding Zn-ribbon protein